MTTGAARCVPLEGCGGAACETLYFLAVGVGIRLAFEPPNILEAAMPKDDSNMMDRPSALLGELGGLGAIIFR
jgi:hypothetical protein